MGVKIAIIGAGSAVFSINLIKDICVNPRFDGSEVTLMDVNERRLTGIYRLCARYIAALLKGRTSFIVAHRLSTIRNCDRIFYIQDGVIAEEGNHDTLMAKKGLYYELYTSQLQEVLGA